MMDIFDLDFMIERIHSDNPWWKGGPVKFAQETMKRDYFPMFMEAIGKKVPNRAIILMGPRRVGKTIMIFQAIQELIDSGVDPKRICYFSLDTPIYTNIYLEKLLKLALEQNKLGPDGTYFFFDEIQYLRDWEVHLKSLVDSYRNTKFVGSGSAAAALRMKSVESGAGRFSDFFLPPLTFAEFVDLNGNGDLLEEIELDFLGKESFYRCDDIAELNVLFGKYIAFGGFPEVAMARQEIPDPQRMIQQDITEKVIMKDLPGLFGIENVLDLRQFFNVIAFRSGEILNYQSIAEVTGNDQKTIKKYLTYLEAAFLARRLLRVDANARRFKNVTQFKVYLTNPSLFTGLFGQVKSNHERFPHLVETTVYAQMLREEQFYLRYANWKEGEVDFVQLHPHMQRARWAAEIKWTDRASTRNLLKFMQKNKILKGVITSKTRFANEEDYLVVPTAVYTYGLGKNAVKRLAGKRNPARPEAGALG